MKVSEAISELEERITAMSFKRLVSICTEIFGAPRTKGSHHIFRTPWPGDPRINLQKDGGEAKPHQVRQVLAALKRLRRQETEVKRSKQ